MPFVNVWTHFVWSTKKRQPILTDPFRDELFEHIKGNARTKNIHLDRINGYHDHVHCLISLSRTDSMDKVAQLLKGESSHWFNNRSGFNARPLYWQNDYFAISIGKEAIDTVRAYIDAQPIHHKKYTFTEEYEKFRKEYGFDPSDFN
jgi:REP element-mobilizing transposase RayT